MNPNPYETPAAAILSTPEPLQQPRTLAWTAAVFLLACALCTGVVAATSVLVIVLVLQV